MTRDYIPARDADFALWLANFAAYLTANAAALGLLPGDAAAVQQIADDYAAAYAISSDPATRTSGAVATTRGLRLVAEAIVRPYAMRINANQSVTDAQRVDLALTVRALVPTPVPAPATSPAIILVGATPGMHTLHFRDSTTPNSKSKPNGVMALMLYASIGPASAASPDSARLLQAVTKTPFNVLHLPSDSGKLVTYYGRWATRSGPSGVVQVGPWSAPLTAVIV